MICVDDYTHHGQEKNYGSSMTSKKNFIHGKLYSLVFHSSFLTGSAVLIVIEFCMYAQCSKRPQEAVCFVFSDCLQQEREEALRDFRLGRCPVPIVSNVDAHGLDIDDVKHVVNYDLPNEIEEFVHRIGRTGCIGYEGKATTLFQKGKDNKIARAKFCLMQVLSFGLCFMMLLCYVLSFLNMSE